MGPEIILQVVWNGETYGQTYSMPPYIQKEIEGLSKKLGEEPEKPLDALVEVLNSLYEAMILGKGIYRALLLARPEGG